MFVSFGTTATRVEKKKSLLWNLHRNRLCLFSFPIYFFSVSFSSSFSSTKWQDLFITTKQRSAMHWAVQLLNGSFVHTIFEVYFFFFCYYDSCPPQPLLKLFIWPLSKTMRPQKQQQESTIKTAPKRKNIRQKKTITLKEKKITSYFFFSSLESFNIFNWKIFHLKCDLRTTIEFGPCYLTIIICFLNISLVIFLLRNMNSMCSYNIFYE